MDWSFCLIKDSTLSLKHRHFGLWEHLVVRMPDCVNFICELLRNADDVGATDVGFELHYGDKLVFTHNGFEMTDLLVRRLVAKLGCFLKYIDIPKVYVGNHCFEFHDGVGVVEKPDDFTRYVGYPRATGDSVFVFQFKQDAAPCFNLSSAIEEIILNLQYPIVFLKNISKVYAASLLEDVNGEVIYKKDVIKTRNFKKIGYDVAMRWIHFVVDKTEWRITPGTLRDGIGVVHPERLNESMDLCIQTNFGNNTDVFMTETGTSIWALT